MVIGVVSWQLEIQGAGSLKDKRSVVKSLKERLKSRFNVSVAETAHQDVWRRAEITACAVGTDPAVVDRLLQKVDAFVESDPRARIIDSYRTTY